MDSYYHLNSRVTYIGAYFELYIKDLNIGNDKLIIDYVLKSKFDKPLLIWNTGMLIGSKKINTMNFICDIVRYNDFKSTIEVLIPNLDQNYIKYASEEITFLFQIDEDENTIEQAEIVFDFNLFLSKKGKRQLKDIQNAISFPDKICGAVSLINDPIPFIKNWNEVSTRYNALDKYSKSTKKLDEWGIVLSSAYLLNPEEASQMWQAVINCNINESKDFSNYFLNQIFHKISDNLKERYATEFLYMDSTRVELMRGWRETEERNAVTKIKNNSFNTVESQETLDLLSSALLNSSRYKIKSNSFVKHQIVFECFKIITQSILLEIQEELKQRDVKLEQYIAAPQKVQRVYLVTSGGQIIRETAMSCSASDTLFCEYLIRLIEYHMRSKVGYVVSKFPISPTINSYSAIYYCHSNGNKGHYRLVDETQQMMLIKADQDIYEKVGLIVESQVNAYFVTNKEMLQKITMVLKS